MFKPQQFKILVIDDEAHIRQLIARYLTQEGYQVNLVESAPMALAYLEENRVDLILTDLRMPGMNGYEICRYIKNHTGLKDTPVVMLTAETDINAIAKAYDHGATEYIRKPFHKVELLARIGNILKIEAGHREMKALYQDLQQDLNMASDIQKVFLPKQSPKNQRFSFESLYKPYMKIGGDILGWHEPNPQEVVFYIGDISGHGIRAALLMTAVKTTLNTILQTTTQPWEIVSRLHKAMSPYFASHYMTFFVGHLNLNTGRLRYFNAGHPSPFLLQEHQMKVLDAVGGMPVGLDLLNTYTPLNQGEITIGRHERLLLYTDGIFDLKAGDQHLGYPEFQALIEKNHTQFNLNEALCSQTETCLKKQGYDIVTDDYTLVSLGLRRPLTQRKLRFFARLEEVEIQAIQLESYLLTQNIDLDTAAQIQLAFIEYTNNIVLHGYSRASNQLIEVDINLFSDCLEMVVRDQGPAWHPDIKRSDEIPLSSTSGRGLALIQSLVERFEVGRFQSENHGCFRKAI